MSIPTLILLSTFSSISLLNAEEPAPIEKTPLGPAQTVQQWAKDAQQGKITKLWNHIPENFQNDICELVRTFGKNVDEELYHESIKTLKAANQLLIEKKPIILEIIADAFDDDKKRQRAIEENYQGITSFLTDLLNSDIQTTQGLQKIDFQKLAADIEPHFKHLVHTIEEAELIAQIVVSEDPSIAPKHSSLYFNNIQAETGSRKGHKATVKISIFGEKLKDTPFIEVNNRWVPLAMHMGWNHTVKKIKQNFIANITKMEAQEKTKIKTLLTDIQGIIQQMNKASSKEEMIKMGGAIMQKL